jgi:acetyl esterase/lipase
MDVMMEHAGVSQLNFAALIYGGDMRGGPVPADAPPLFTMVAQDDPLNPPAMIQDIYEHWTAAGIPAELHVFAKGGHGFGTTKRGLPIDHWVDVFGNWLNSQVALESPH